MSAARERLVLEGDSAVIGGGRLVVTRQPHGWSIEYRGENPTTRYWPSSLSWWDALRFRWWARIRRSA